MTYSWYDYIPREYSDVLHTISKFSYFSGGMDGDAKKENLNRTKKKKGSQKCIYYLC